MTQPRSSLALALQDYRGPRPGVALTIAAVALLAAMVLGAVHVVGLGRAATRLRESQQSIRALHRYNAALEVWRQMAVDQLEFTAQRRLRDSLAVALRAELTDLRSSMRDSTDRALVSQVLDDLQRPKEPAAFELGVPGREAMILLVSRQEAALFEAAAASQRARLLGGALIALTVVAAGVLIIPMSWVYVRFKRGIPPGM
jgi:hypothetical protein